MSYFWDGKKAAKNVEKHGVSFEEAVSVFDDSLFLVFADPDHSLHEQRFIIVGESSMKRLTCRVVHRTPEGDSNN
jgi:uncharacterized DUF497 family protein